MGSFTSENRAVLVRMLAELAPGDVNRTQLYSSGAEAVESALRLAKSYTGEDEVIGFWGGFHGKTAGVLPLLGLQLQVRSRTAHARSLLLAVRVRAPLSASTRHIRECDCDACRLPAQEDSSTRPPNDIAAIIVEPIQGTAGNIVPPADF